MQIQTQYKELSKNLKRRGLFHGVLSLHWKPYNKKGLCVRAGTKILLCWVYGSITSNCKICDWQFSLYFSALLKT